ncbi:NUDIX domain-containing protein [Actinoplanes sp. NPDC049596]|uniref:NUDIX hydrolase n=1 Tax=unclassified Actinoplanes TaxID=2626549 RepID=UPI00343874A4
MSQYARRSARVILLNAADRVLLLRSALAPPSQGHLWLTPGGAVEEGEDLSTAAARELHEEVGLAVAPGELRPIAYSEGHVEFSWASGLFRDDFFLHRVHAHEVDTSGHTALEQTHYRGFRWWSVGELQSTTEDIFPYGLEMLLKRVMSGDVPAVPVRLPWGLRK